jgi:hypothetical protein
LGNTQSGLFYSYSNAWKKLHKTNFYDTGTSSVAALTLREVTGGYLKNDISLKDFLAGANAVTANPGFDRQTAILLKAGLFDQSDIKFTLVHELLIHAISGLPDQQVFLNSFLQQHGLWRSANDGGTLNISKWISTDCTCTPGVPGSPCTKKATW